MPRKTIAHLDADAFFASVEQAGDSRLRGKPIAVGGESRGIIASASYEARKFGVYTPMPTARAYKLCPKLLVLPGHYERYEEFSKWMFAYAYDFTPDVERTSIDEGYFDLTANRQKSPVEIAQIIRKAIAQKLKISVSQGLGANKLISQIASKLNKPAAFLAIPHGNEIGFLHPLPNKWLPGIGPKTSLRLNAAGLAHKQQQTKLVPTTYMKNTTIIRLTEARPMRVHPYNWPVVASATKSLDHNRQELFRRYFLRVRAHAVEGGPGNLEYYGSTEANAPALDLHPDGAVIVHGWHETSWQGESDIHSGYVCTLAEAATQIRRVGDEIGAPEHLILECVGDLPPIEEPEPESPLTAYSTAQLIAELEKRKSEVPA